jgi:hypothetical protein
LKRDKKPGESELRSTEPMQLIHVDLTGIKMVKTPEGKNQALVMVDDFSGFTWIKLLQNRTEAKDAFLSVKRLIENEKAPRKVAAIRTDGAREFVVDSNFHRMCDEEGIAQQVSAPHSESQYQNGRAERKIGVLMFKINEGHCPTGDSH